MLNWNFFWNSVWAVIGSIIRPFFPKVEVVKEYELIAFCNYESAKEAKYLSQEHQLTR